MMMLDDDARPNVTRAPPDPRHKGFWCKKPEPPSPSLLPAASWDKKSKSGVGLVLIALPTHIEALPAICNWLCRTLCRCGPPRYLLSSDSSASFRDAMSCRACSRHSMRQEAGHRAAMSSLAVKRGQRKRRCQRGGLMGDAALYTWVQRGVFETMGMSAPCPGPGCASRDPPSP